MVSEYGMGETLGLSTYPRQNRPLFIKPEQAPLLGKEYSEETAAKLDKEVTALIDQRAAAVRSMLDSNRVLLEKVAEKLLESETMEAGEFYELIQKEDGIEKSILEQAT